MKSVDGQRGDLVRWVDIAAIADRFVRLGSQNFSVFVGSWDTVRRLASAELIHDDCVLFLKRFCMVSCQLVIFFSSGDTSFALGLYRLLANSLRIKGKLTSARASDMF